MNNKYGLFVAIRSIIASSLMLYAAIVLPACASDARFASGTSALRIPFRLRNNRIFLQLTINNSRPFWFILDTGASSTIINSRNAQALGLQLHGNGRAIGAGETNTDVSIAEGVTVALPGATLSEPIVAVLSLESLEACLDKIIVDSQGRSTLNQRPTSPAEHSSIDGILGYQIFNNFVVEIDYANGYINLYEPKSYQYSGTGESIPLEVSQGLSFVSAQITPQGRATLTGRFLIDTGLSSAIVLNSPFIKINDLLPTAQPAAPFTGCGVGGEVNMLIGTTKNLQLGRINIENPVTSFSQMTNGNFARSDYVGVIGGAILRRYKVVFDYSRRRMILG